MKKTSWRTEASPETLFSGDGKRNDRNGEIKLTGKWEAAAEHILENGQWVLNFTYRQCPSQCEFREDGRMIDHCHGNKTVVHYSYDASAGEVRAMDTVMEVETLTASELVLRQTTTDDPPKIYKTTFRRK